MATVRVSHGIDDLRSDLAGIPVELASKAPRILRRNADQGNRLAQKFAKGAGGPHGLHYHKRMSAELLSPTEAEYGPEGVVEENAVGAGWRNGPPNTDLPRSADIQGPRFASDVSALVDGLFW